jgi:hypothetical protein
VYTRPKFALFVNLMDINNPDLRESIVSRGMPVKTLPMTSENIAYGEQKAVDLKMLHCVFLLPISLYFLFL